MDFGEFRDYCLSKSGVTEDYPFEGNAVWMKVLGKLFAIANIDEMKRAGEIIPPFQFINMKCDPEKAIELREMHEEIKPGWHQNKKHWNTVYMDGSLSDKFIYELIDHSYDIVVQGMTKKLKDELNLLNSTKE